jgi:ABC-type multidrug transport system fused ATPase/permease subunit
VKRRLLSEQIRWALSYLKPYTLGILGVFALAFTQNFAFSMLPMAGTTFLFELLTPENLEKIYRYFGLAMGLLVVKAVFNFLERYANEIINAAALKRMRDDLFSHLMLLDLSYFSEHKTGNIVSIGISDVEEVKRLIYNSITSFMSNLILLVIIVIRLMMLNWLLTVVSFAMMPMLYFVVRFIGNKIRSVSIDHRENLGLISTNLHETLMGVEVVKSFVSEDLETEAFKKHTQSYKKTYRRIMGYQTFLEPFTDMVIYLIIMGLIGVGSIFIIRGNWELKLLTEYLMLLGIMNMPIRFIPRSISNFKMASASVDRVRKVLMVKPSIVEPVNPIEKQIEGVVEFKDVWFSYDSKNDVLEDISFKAEKGDIVALVGPSGAGKSTIANLIPRFYDCRSGEVLVDGIDVRQFSLRSLRTQVGIVSQNISLFNTTIRENIMYGKRDAGEEEIIEAARKAYAYDFIMELPKQFETNVGERGVKLSGGQKQRISIARTVLMNPEILILDEATSSLDSESEYYIQLAINELMEGRTSIIIAHRLSTINHASKIVVLERGRIVDIGSHEELMERCSLYSKIYDLQYFR